MPTKEELKKLVADIDKALGDRPAKQGITLRDFLSAHYTRNEAIKTRKTIEDSFSKLATAVESLVNKPEKEYPEPKEAVTVTNLKDIPTPVLKIPPYPQPLKEIKVTNLDEIRFEFPKIKFPTLFDIVKPKWLEPLLDKYRQDPIDLSKILDAIKGLGNFRLPKEAKDAIPVRLSNGKEFYEAVTQLFGGGGGGKAYKKANSELTEGLVDSDRHVQVDQVSSILQESYDYVAVTYPTTSSEVYTFKTGGSGGTTVHTITLNYTDATKASLSTVART